MITECEVGAIGNASVIQSLSIVGKVTKNIPMHLGAFLVHTVYKGGYSLLGIRLPIISTRFSACHSLYLHLSVYICRLSFCSWDGRSRT